MKKRKLLAFPLIGLAMLGMMSCGEEKTSDTLTPIQRPTTTPVQSSTIEESEGVKLSNITIDDTKMKKTYYEGQDIDFTGLVVNARYTDGTVKQVTDYTYDESTYNPNQKGDQFVKIIYTDDGVTKTRSIHVLVKTVLDSVNNVVGITAKTNKTSYKYNEELDLSDLTVTAFYEDGSTKLLTSDQYTVSKESFNSKMRGDYEIGVTFKEDYTVDGVTRSCEVETCFFASVVLNMDSIKVTKGTSKFLQYSNIDISDWEVEITYKEGVKEVITDGFTTDLKSKFKDSSEAKSDNVNVAFTYNGVTKNCTRTVEIVKANKTFTAGLIDITNTPASEDVAVGKFVVNKGYIVSNDSQSCGCQSFARSVILNGAGTRDEYSIEFDATIVENRVTVVAASQEGSEIGLYDADGNVVKTYKVGTTLQRYTFELKGKGKYYIWSTGGVSVYFIGTYVM